MTTLFFSSLFSRDGWGFWPLGPAVGDDVDAVAEADEDAMMYAIEGKEADYTADRPVRGTVRERGGKRVESDE